MDARIFRDEPMQLEDTLLGLRLEDRLSYDAERNTLFLNLEGMHLRTRDDVDRGRRVFEERCRPSGARCCAVVNYDGFVVDPAVADTYAAMVRYIDTHYYAAARATRPAPSCASSWARRWRAAASRRTSSSRPRKRMPRSNLDARHGWT